MRGLYTRTIFHDVMQRGAVSSNAKHGKTTQAKDNKTIRRLGMTSDMKQLCATIGRALLALAGEQAQEPQVEPEQKAKGRYPPRPVRTATCIVCGAEYQTSSARAELCPHCRILRTNRNRAFMEAYKKAKLGTQEPVPQDVPPLVNFLSNQPPAEKVRCERMHAWISPVICGTRGECQGKPLCPHLQGGRG